MRSEEFRASSTQKKRLKRDPDAKGIPINKVRVLRKEQTIQPIREGRPDQAMVKPGATHHLCVFEWEAKGTTKRDTISVTQLEAINRIERQQQELSKQMDEWKQEGLSPREIAKRKRRVMSEIAKAIPVIDRNPPKGHGNIPVEASFVMSLSSDEQVLAEKNGAERLLVFRTASTTSQQMWFAEHTDSRKSSEYKKYSFSPNTLNARKVTIDPLGQIRSAND